VKEEEEEEGRRRRRRSVHFMQHALTCPVV
jgi:hypothetical protein